MMKHFDDSDYKAKKNRFFQLWKQNFLKMKYCFSV